MRNEQGQFIADSSDKPSITVRQEAEHYYGATLPDGKTIGATDKARLIRHLRAQGFQVSQ